MMTSTMIISYADSTIAYFPPYPKDISIYISRPEISMKLILNGNSIESIDMRLDGTSVSAKYDQTKKMIVYKPNVPLASGQHTVDLEVRLRGWTNHLSQSWSFTVSENAISSFPLPTDEQRAAQDFVNTFRSKLGLHPVTVNSSLNLAANAHTNYMILNLKTTHDELQGNKGYTGGTPFIRAKSYGYNGISASENVSSGYKDLNKALQEFIDAPYHRLAWIDPYADHIGYSGKSGYHTLLFGSMAKGPNNLIFYPYNTQREVPISWQNFETPNPLRGTTDNSIGYPITISYFSEDKITSMNVQSITLKDSSGKNIETYIKHPKNDEYLTDSIIVIPTEPLEGSTRYTVTAKFTLSFEGGATKGIYRDISFTTKEVKKYAFKDISNHWASDVIDMLGKEGVVTAKEGDYFKPDSYITRGDFCVFISKMLGLSVRELEGSFKDVNSNTKNFAYIEAAKRFGIINGYEDGTFRAEEKITREEMAVMIRRTYEKKTNNIINVSTYTTSFIDKSSISSWAESSVKLCNKLGILKGREDGGFYPYNNTTRAESAVIIDRLMKMLK